MPRPYHTANASEAQVPRGGFIYSMAFTRLDLLGLYFFQVVHALSSRTDHKLSKEENAKTALPGQDCHRLFALDAYNANLAARTAPTHIC